MPLESHQRISIRTKRQKSSAEKEKAEAQLKRIRDMIDKENRKDRHKTAQETRGNLKEFLRQMKPKDAPNKEESWNWESDLSYKWLGGISVKNEEGAMNMRVAGPKFGNDNGAIALGVMHESQKDIPSWEAEWHIGIGLAGSFKF